MELLGIIAIISVIIQLIKEAFTPKIPAENWVNQELMHQDIMSGMSIEEHLKCAAQGRYRLDNTKPKK